MKSSLKAFVETVITDSFFIERLQNVVMETELPNRLSYHGILLIETGSGKLIVDDKSLPLDGQELFLMAKGQVYLFEKASVVNGYMLFFGDCFWEKAPASASNCKAVLFNNAAANQHLRLSVDEMKELSVLFSTLLDEYTKPDYANRVDALAAYLKIIMIKIANVRITEEISFNSPDYILYRKFMELISTNYKTYREVSDYAAMLDITARRLSDLCRRCSNKSAKDIINGQLLAEAKRALQFSSGSVKEIAYELSFSTPEQFSHFFKKSTHFSPAQYRSKFIGVGV